MATTTPTKSAAAEFAHAMLALPSIAGHTPVARLGQGTYGVCLVARCKATQREVAMVRRGSEAVRGREQKGGREGGGERGP